MHKKYFLRCLIAISVHSFAVDHSEYKFAHILCPPFFPLEQKVWNMNMHSLCSHILLLLASPNMYLYMFFFLNIYSIVVSCSMSIRHEANGIPIWVADGLMGLIHADGKIAIRIGNKQGQNNPNDIITGCFVHHLFWSFYITFYSLHLLGWRVCLLEMLLFLRRRSRDCELHHQPKQVLCFPSWSYNPFQRRAQRA